MREEHQTLNPVRTRRRGVRTRRRGVRTRRRACSPGGAAPARGCAAPEGRPARRGRGWAERHLEKPWRRMSSGESPHIRNRCAPWAMSCDGMHLGGSFLQGASASCALGARGREASLASMGAMITVCDISALARWGEVGLAQRLGEPCPEPPDKAWSLASAAALEKIDLRGARIEATEARPLHILVSGEARRVRTPVVRCHIWSTALPPDALYQLTDEVLLASPAFCLQQMAARSSLARAVAVGTEICGGTRAPHGPRTASTAGRRS